jgi:hyperosmotically inducible protein
MINKLKASMLASILASTLGVAGACSNHENGRAAEKPTDPDNTAVNDRDRSGATVTPLDQRENEHDLAATKELREALVGDEQLSFDAKNIKIVTQDGVMTLRGPVKSDAERQAIELRARRVPGISSVHNELELSAK